MSTEEVSNAQNRSFPGEELAAARESLGIGFEQLSSELHLPVRTLQAIENGELKGLGGPVFVRGYIRAYAKRLKLEPDRYVTLCDSCLGVQDSFTPVKVVGTISTTPARQSRSLMRLGSLVFVIAILGVVIWWWQTQYSIDSVLSGEADAPVTVDTADGNTLVLPALDDEPASDAESQSDGSSESNPVTTDAAASADSEQSEQSVSSADTDSDANSESGPEPKPESLTSTGGDDSLNAAESEAGAVSRDDEQKVSESASSAPAPAAAPAVTSVAAKPKGLHLVLREDSWLSIHDGNGRSLYNGIARAGSDLVFDGVTPLSVVIGRASAVARIEFAGKPVDISAVSNKNVARLKLSAPQR